MITQKMSSSNTDTTYALLLERDQFLLPHSSKALVFASIPLLTGKRCVEGVPRESHPLSFEQVEGDSNRTVI